MFLPILAQTGTSASAYTGQSFNTVISSPRSLQLLSQTSTLRDPDPPSEYVCSSQCHNPDPLFLCEQVWIHIGFQSEVALLESSCFASLMLSLLSLDYSYCGIFPTDRTFLTSDECIRGTAQ